MEPRHIVKRGASSGTVLVPAKDKKGQYTTAPDRFAARQEKHADLKGALEAVTGRGHGIRMSPNGRGERASLIKLTEE